MKFIDTAVITVKSGKGGDGHISFRREKGIPKGGPDGGNGGKGGDIYFVANKHLNTLLDFKYQPFYKAENGQPGGKSNKTGRDGKDLIIYVPCGTLIKNYETNELIADLVEDGQICLVAEGGKGGKGNAEFATPTNQAPRYAQKGAPGIEMKLLLELKVIADVGIVGFPNVGKSTLISVISAAKPKIADYPFTTLTPNLGIVKIDVEKSFVVADIPGLIEGASKGKGMGNEFLRHIERTNCLLFLIDSLSENPLEDYKILKKELKNYNKSILEKSKVICFSKIDAITEDRLEQLKKIKFRESDTPVLFISSVAQIGIEQLKQTLWNFVSQETQFYRK